MKYALSKLILINIIGAIIFIIFLSCSSNQTGKIQKIPQSEIDASEYKFDKEGHTYIIWESTTYGTRTIIHDPNCEIEDIRQLCIIYK